MYSFFLCYNKNGDNMKIEKWIYKGEEVEVPVLEEDEIEVNMDSPDFDITKDLTKELEKVGEDNYE